MFVINGIVLVKSIDLKTCKLKNNSINELKSLAQLSGLFPAYKKEKNNNKQ